MLLDELGLSPTLQRMLPDIFPHGAILLTADLPLGSDFERLPVGPLPRADAVNLLATKADLTLNQANRAGLDALCALLNDVSLAIVISGNVLREKQASLEDALQAIRQIPVTTQDPVSAALDRAFSFAFGRLSPEQQKVLSAAALTPAVSSSPDWLSAALPGVDVAAALERLTALGLLFANSPRLRLPPGFRAQARRAAVLDEGQLLPLLVAFLTAPLQADPQNWEHIREELGNFFGALTWAVRARRWTEVVALGRAIDPYLSLHGLWDTWGMALGYILDAARQTGEQSVQAWALHQSGVREIGVGTRRQALDLLKQALELRRDLGDTVGMAYTQHNIDFLIGLPPAGQNDPKPHSPKPAGGGTHPFWIGWLAAAGILVLAVLATVIGLGILRPPVVTPPPYIPPVVLTTPPPPIILTSTPTPRPLPLGGSGQIIFAAWPDPLKKDFFTLFTFNAGDPLPHQSFQQYIPAGQPAWSPDGQSLAFTSNYKSDFSEIYVANADGSNMRQITQGPGDKSRPAWSPDGMQIVYVYGDPLSSSDIYSMDGDGGNQQNLTNGDGARYDDPEWSPDGSRIVYQAFRAGNWELFSMNADGSKPLQLTRSLRREKISNIQPSWSPDGRQIVFAGNAGGSFDIFVMNSDGSDPRALTQDQFDDLAPDWSPDGRLIAFISNRDGHPQLYVMASDGSGLTLLLKMPGTASDPDWRPARP